MTKKEKKQDRTERGTTDWDRDDEQAVTDQINARLRHCHIRGARAQDGKTQEG